MRRLMVILLLLAGSSLLQGWHVFGPATSAIPTRTMVFSTEPVDLPANAAHDQADQPEPQFTVLEASGWLHGYRIELVDANGRAVPLEVLHHVKVLSTTRRELFSPIMMRVAGAGADTKPVQLPQALGYPLQRGDTLALSAMLHNPGASAYQGVRVRVIAQYTPRVPPPEPEAVFPFLVNVTPPDSDNMYDLPPGYSQRSRIIRPAIPGRLIGLGGHMHRYGMSLKFENVTTGDVVWSEQTVRDSAHNVLDIPTRRFRWRGGVRIRPDHVYRITGVYFNPTGDTLRAGGMATIGGALQPDDGVAWPALDRNDPLYQHNLTVELGTGATPHGAHKHR